MQNNGCKKNILKKATALMMTMVVTLSSIQCFADTVEPVSIQSQVSTGNKESQAVQVIETDKCIEIKANISFEGDLSDTLTPKRCFEHVNEPRYTYKEAFVEGVKQMWEGTYKGKSVIVTLNEVDETDDTDKVHVIFLPVTNVGEDSEDYPKAAKSWNTIWFYTGDGRTNSSYDYHQIVDNVAGHEFGHILGLDDIYNEENSIVKNNLISPMNKLTTTKATNIDYYMILKYRTWEMDDFNVKYSDDKFVVACSVLWNAIRNKEVTSFQWLKKF